MQTFRFLLLILIATAGCTCDPVDPAAPIKDASGVDDVVDMAQPEPDLVDEEVTPVPVCGDGIVDEGEACDDANTVDGDGCSALCDSNETCGNGVQDNSVLEKCDDGNNESGDGCSADCLSDEVCGNGVVDTARGEVCDDGNRDNRDGCSANCLSDETCGNGTIDSGETCDDGNDSLADDCPSGPYGRCVEAICGDGFVHDQNEACDGDGIGSGGETGDCNIDCSIAVCGDGIQNGSAGETCDDGNGVDEDGCPDGASGLCRLARCGDGVVFNQNGGTEVCDEGSETPTCDVDCSLPECGDGVRQYRGWRSLRRRKRFR